MGQFYEITTWLEDRESDLLKKYDFSEEVHENDIHEDERYILHDLEIKGFLYSCYFDDEYKYC